MTNPTDEELTYLRKKMHSGQSLSRQETWRAFDAIAALRAQLAEAMAEGSSLAAWQCEFTDGKTGLVCDEYGNQFCAMKVRADRAEAALAAQIEDACAVAWRWESCANSQGWDTRYGCEKPAPSDYITDIVPLYEAQAHDRSALDRMLAEAREKALREAAAILDEEGWLGMSKHRILALVDKP